LRVFIFEIFRFLIIHHDKAKSTAKTACKQASVYFPASATREILDEFWPYFCEAGSDQFNQRCLSAFHTFLPVKVYPEEIDSTVGLWFNDLMEKWMNLDIPKQWEKRIVSKLFCEFFRYFFRYFLSFFVWNYF